MEPHEQLLQWAEAKGVKLDGIAPQRLPGRGMGIVATRSVQADEILLEVPARCLRSIETVPKSLSRRLPRDISVHGLLAADLALDRSDMYAAWNAVCPTPADFASMPLYWPPGLQALLPGPARGLLARQRAKVERDWAAASKLFLSSSTTSTTSPDASIGGDDSDGRNQEQSIKEGAVEEDETMAKQRFVHAWLLVNTRTFYHESPRLRRRAKEDRMVLQPVADLFNHAGSRTGWCHVAFDAASFIVRADRRYEAGDEVRICYGRHGGDLLLVEYGFVLGSGDDDDDNEEGWLEENCWDEVGLDDVLLPRLSDSAKDKLSEVGFLGGYVLDAGTVCYRTQVALRALCCLQTGREEEWRRFIEDGEDADAARQGEVDGLFVSMLEEYRDQTIGKTISKVAAMEEEGEGGGSSQDQRALLCKRWRHVDRLVRITIERLKAETATNKTH
ncbi:Ribosomal lysine N-methyltransferase s.t1.c11 [Apiospora kogelbergensis]|uniref:Ribosomal lysine N-methyltransferase s.t1.c11 n=1 Tax=Apiospora kogelbergensis TaxID=1337665 RepID=UPI003130F99B